MAPALAERARPAGDTRVRNALQPLVLVFGIGEAARSPAFWVPYRILGELPIEALDRGVKDYLAAPDSQFFPKPGPLKAFCDKHARPMFQAAHRAAEAARLEPRPAARGEYREAIGHLMADFKTKSLVGKPSPLSPRRADMPSTAGKPDEGGLTPQMRNLIARRAEGGAA